MKKNFYISIITAVLLLTSNIVAVGQAFHYKAGFGDAPEGWTLTNTFLTSTGSNVHNEFDGAKAVKMKGVESVVQTAAYNTAAVLEYWIRPMLEGAVLTVEMSTNNSTNWTNLETYTTVAGDLEVYHKRTIDINDDSDGIAIRITASGGDAGDGIFYLDDMSLSMGGAAVDDATLNEINVNGSPIVGYVVDFYDYNLELYYTEDVTITTIPTNDNATVVINKPTDLFGTEAERTVTIDVTAEDGSSTQTYTLILDVTDFLFKSGMQSSGENVFDEPNWDPSYSYMSSNIPGPGNHDEFYGDNAFKFIRGQADKLGGLLSPAYANLGTLTFWMMIDVPEATAQMTIYKKIGDADSVEVAVIVNADLSDSEWTQFTYDINEVEPTSIRFSPTLPTDGDTRLWLDDLTITYYDYVSGIQQTIKSTNPQVFPNPANDMLNINLNGNKYQNLSIYNVIGKQIYQQSVDTDILNIDLSNTKQGIYFIQLEGESGNYTSKFVKK